MQQSTATSVLTLVVSLLLIWVIFEDFRRFRIRNVLVLALALCFVADCMLRDRLAPLLSHGLFALLALGVLCVFFALHMIGGGDVKLLATAILWVGPNGCVLFAVALLLCTILYLVGHRGGLLPARHQHGRLVIPFGPSIAAAWLIYNAAIALTGS